jgi:hypothetical protein
MTPRSRYILLGSAALLPIGLAAGLIAYLAYNRAPGLPAGVPGELRYVPADAEIVAYADVQAIANSALRRELDRIATESGRGRKDMSQFAGLDLEKQVSHVVAYLESMDTASPSPLRATRAMILARGTFEPSAIEQFIREHGGTIEDYRGKRLGMHRPEPRGDRSDGRDQGGKPDLPPQEMAVGFVQPGLIALGQADLVKRVLDLASDRAAERGPDITTNTDVMNLITDASGSTAWVVGRFDAVSRRIGIPTSLTRQVPPLRLVSARAAINGGVKATITAETADQAAAEQVRDVVRGFISLMRLQAGAKPALQSTLKSIELAAADRTVQLSFAMTSEAIRAIAPQPGQPEPQVPAPSQGQP